MRERDEHSREASHRQLEAVEDDEQPPLASLLCANDGVAFIDTSRGGRARPLAARRRTTAQPTEQRHIFIPRTTSEQQQQEEEEVTALLRAHQPARHGATALTNIPLDMCLQY